MTRAKRAVHRLVQRVGFFGILLCASVSGPYTYVPQYVGTMKLIILVTLARCVANTLALCIQSYKPSHNTLSLPINTTVVVYAGSNLPCSILNMLLICR